MPKTVAARYQLSSFASKYLATSDVDEYYTDNGVMLATSEVRAGALICNGVDDDTGEPQFFRVKDGEYKMVHHTRPTLSATWS